MYRPTQHSLFHRWARPVVAIVTALLIPAGQADDFPGLRSMMSDAEYAAAGLERLSSAERTALNRWLATYGTFQFKPAPEPATAQPPTESTQPATAATTPPVKPQHAAPTVVRTRIIGEFRGWSGKTRFALENGQVWQQRTAQRYFHKATNPDVEIFKNRFGFYNLRLVATGHQVGVKRLK